MYTDSCKFWPDPQTGFLLTEEEWVRKDRVRVQNELAQAEAERKKQEELAQAEAEKKKRGELAKAEPERNETQVPPVQNDPATSDSGSWSVSKEQVFSFVSDVVCALLSRGRAGGSATPRTGSVHVRGYTRGNGTPVRALQQETSRVRSIRTSCSRISSLSLHGADLTFTDAAIKEIATIALEHGTGARSLRSVIEEVLEGVLFDPENWERSQIE